jgi:hypothetical protein
MIGQTDEQCHTHIQHQTVRNAPDSGTFIEGGR